MFDDEGILIPCTVISTKDGNIVTEIKTQERDGYDAVQVRVGCTRPSSCARHFFCVCFSSTPCSFELFLRFSFFFSGLLPPLLAVLQVGYEISKEKHLTKPQLGHLRKNNLPTLRRLGEFRVKSTDGYEIGQKLEVTPT